MSGPASVSSMSVSGVGHAYANTGSPMTPMGPTVQQGSPAPPPTTQPLPATSQSSGPTAGKPPTPVPVSSGQFVFLEIL